MNRGSSRSTVAVGLLYLATALGVARTVDFAGARLETVLHGKTECVPLTSVATALHGRSWRVADRFVMVLAGDSAAPGPEYVFRADSIHALCDGRRVQLPAAPVKDGDRLCIPVVALARLFPSSHVPELQALETSRQGDTLVFTFKARCRPGEKMTGLGDSKSSLGYHLVLGARPDSGFGPQVAILSLTPPGLLKSVVLDSSGGTDMTFSFTQPVAERLSVLSDRVELRVWPRPVRAIKRIVLDPGHGGESPGAVGRRGTREKVVVLDVARRLKKKLEKQGFDVILTRDSDTFVSLADRSKCGNGQKADLFVSIHANASPNRAACGLETYFLSEAKTDWERAVASRENAALQMEDSGPALDPGDDVGLILADLAQNEYLVESSELAAQIQEKTVPYARIKDRGVRQANFYVLRNNFMPAVLVECGFLSNRSEERLLRQADHRERLAEGICRGIVAFAKLYSPKVNGSTSGGRDKKTGQTKS
ncbi:N-acetylmuramoyl-L-alanine amidase [candidate division WOR-3 bacterium]|nr:N-acetylmuramoyl-L-alanine amidase [candidate division WOR-3 bacterium]